ncbi:hypothetical protein MMC12_000160 [Toensbergia leucococca]|nr:hypothetical protein [Toensbergia leucococca]
MPILQSLAGTHFPKTHTRRYIQRSESSTTNADYPATILVGAQADFEYDAISELVFEDEAAFQAFFASIGQVETAEKIAKDEKIFIDQARTRVVVVGDCVVTTGAP